MTGLLELAAHCGSGEKTEPTRNVQSITKIYLESFTIYIYLLIESE